MDKMKNRKWILLTELVLALLLICAPVVVTLRFHEITGAPKAVNGTMDLSNYGLNKQIILDGQWEFYWQKFIISEPAHVGEADFLINVPDAWSNYRIGGKSLPTGGCGSYRLLLKNVSYLEDITLLIPDYGGAYRAYIDGQLVARSGVASKDNGKIFTTPKSDMFPVILSKAATHEVVIEVATTRFAGLYMAPSLFDYGYITSAENIVGSIRLILFGVALFAFISLLTIYFFSIRRKIYSFWMPVLVLFILIRMMLTTEFYHFWQSSVFFNRSYELTNELMYFVTFVMMYLVIFMVQEQCGIMFDRKEKYGFLIFYALLYFLYLIIPRDFYNHYLSVTVPALTFTIDIYLFIKIYRMRNRLSKYGMVAFLGITLIVIGLAVNSFYINGVIYVNLSLTMMISFTLFLLIMVWVYSMRMGDLYDDFTISSSRLEIAGKQIAIQKEYYEKLSRQMNEIREIKHDINHFTGVMIQLAEQGNYERLKTFLNEYCEKSKMDQLPVFCDHVVGNSIIGHYYLQAREYGIIFDSQCNISEQTVMKDSDLCIVLGNTLENAIYACKQMDPSQPGFILIESEEMKGQWLFKVSNSYQGQINVKDGRYLSSKGGNSHGFGIRNVTKIVEAYGGFVKIEHNESVFILMAAIPMNGSIK